MTEEQLIKNLSRSNYLSSNYIKLVKDTAYHEIMYYNKYITYINQVINYLRENDYMTYPFGKCRVYSKNSHKYVNVTKYTKKLRYRTYRQQLAISYRQLEKHMLRVLTQRSFAYLSHYINLDDDTEYNNIWNKLVCYYANIK